MRTIVELLETVPMTRVDTKEPYNLYVYLLDDGQVVDTPSRFNIGELVEVWFDDKWDKVKIRRGYEQRKEIDDEATGTSA